MSMGQCAGCGVEIPWGATPLVMPPTSRASVVPRLDRDYTTKHERVDLYCRTCPDSSGAVNSSLHHRRRKLQLQEEQVVELSARDIAVRLLKVLNDEPASSKKLLVRAELDEDYGEVALMVLKKLAEAGKIKKVKTEEGGVRWASLN